MKDLEKIKSEDLGCQVADANPGNFAIEQEVAQLVGATVPAPTEPSADDARELGAQLLVFLRRALLPIRSALRTALAAIYAHLDSRCTDYTPAAYAPYQDPSTVPPYDPMRPLTPRTLPNLLTAITAFSARKISNGSATNDGIPDGVSLAHLLYEGSEVTIMIDDNKGWIMDSPYPNISSLFPSVEELHIGAKKIITDGFQSINGNNTFKVLVFDNLTTFTQPDYSTVYGWDMLIRNCNSVEQIIADKLSYIQRRPSSQGSGGWIIGDCPNLKRLVIGDVVYFRVFAFVRNVPKLIDIEMKGSNVSLDFKYWDPSYVLSDNPTGNDLVTDEGISTNLDQFLQNFKEHIALRLTDQGSGLTLTLSQAVFDTIWKNQTSEQPQDNPIAQQIHQIIRVQKHWAVNRA